MASRIAAWRLKRVGLRAEGRGGPTKPLDAIALAPEESADAVLRAVDTLRAAVQRANFQYAVITFDQTSRLVALVERERTAIITDRRAERGRAAAHLQSFELDARCSRRGDGRHPGADGTGAQGAGRHADGHHGDKGDAR
ncbi:hypothetical protein T492DRAFT_407413 [Pavlovales sp. CCMP2436]|nr:hypothetical protein T492DRAFT_407413 [Pavlovales sp. CCMP2436]